MNLKSWIVLSISAVAFSNASAIVFYNVDIQSPPLSDGSSWTALGNSISFALPNAIVGDPVDPTRAGSLDIRYDAFTAAPAIASHVGVNLGVAISGSGTIIFEEQVFEIDNVGNELGGPIGTITHAFNPGDPMNWSGTITFSRAVERFRAKKFFSLSAADTANFDIAALGIVNQNIQVVPEPATMAAIGVGVAALLRRRKRA